MEIRFTDKDDKATPETVDPLSAMAFASAFLTALQEEARIFGKTLTFEGFQIAPGSVRFATKPNDKAAARKAEQMVKQALQSGSFKTKPHIQKLMRASVDAEFQSATVKVDKRETKFDFASVFAREEPKRTELTSLRAVFLGIEARSAVSPAKARFVSVLTPESMRLLVKDAVLEQRLVASFRQEFDIEVEFERDLVTEDLSGRLLNAELVRSGDALREWKAWFEEVGRAWLDVSSSELDAERNEGDS